jgi:hypothetical protein
MLTLLNDFMENKNDLENNQQFGKQLPKIGDLLSAPLVAAASANSIMIREQTRFLMDTCFISKGSNQYEPLMIEMSMSKSVLSEDENHEMKRQDITSSFKIPLLTLVPINSLVVDNVDIDFSLEIVSYTSNQGNSSEKSENERASKGMIDRNSKNDESVLSGKLSYDANDKGANRSHNAAKLNVKIHAGSIPLPVGVTTLIDLYVKSINAIPKKLEE